MELKKIHSELVKEVKKGFGKRCKEYAFGCINCRAWQIVDEVGDMEFFTNEKNWKPLKLKKK